MPRAQRFFSSSAARAGDGRIVIALFNGRRSNVGLFKGSEDAALNSAANILVAVTGDENSSDDGAPSKA